MKSVVDDESKLIENKDGCGVLYSWLFLYATLSYSVVGSGFLFGGQTPEWYRSSHLTLGKKVHFPNIPWNICVWNASEFQWAFHSHEHVSSSQGFIDAVTQYIIGHIHCHRSRLYIIIVKWLLLSVTMTILQSCGMILLLVDREMIHTSGWTAQ